MLAFALYRSLDGHLSLRFHWRLLPVNASYLEAMLKESCLTVKPCQRLQVGAAWAQDAIDEALMNLDHQITSAETDKRRLLYYFGKALETSEPSGESPVEGTGSPASSEVA